MASYSIVEYFGGDDAGRRCGYCGKSNTNYSQGMWAHVMTCLDYQDLIDRGWRRSGKYVYKPTMKKMCCPAYTIKCDALSFHPSKSQKKVLKKMTKFLTIPESESIPKADCLDAVRCPPGELHEVHEPAFVEPLPGKKPSGTVKAGDISTDKLGGKVLQGTEDLKIRKGSENSQEAASSGRPACEPPKNTKLVKRKKPAPGLGADPSKPPCQKAKILRQERKEKKLTLAKGEQAADSEGSSQNSRVPVTKSLEDFMIDRLPGQSPVHDLQIKLIPSDPNNPEFMQTFPQTRELFFKYQRSIHKDPPEKCTERRVKLVRVDMQSDEFKATYQQTCALFAKYQIAIHKDHPHECGESQFKRFLVDSPLVHTSGPGAPAMGFGSFHQQYFLDGKLVAVGVLDILPHCVSSVYLFYDTDYSFLSLGVYSALREIQLTRHLQRTVPAVQNYYMGFYIHSCPKMRYKGNYTPSYLACPETFNWIPIEQCRPKLDLSKYSRLDDSDEEPPKASTEDVLVCFERQAMPYQIYAAITAADDDEEVQEYAELVGPVVSSRMLLFRSG